MLTIVIPTINEEKNIGRTLDKISLIKKIKISEIIIVDDQSKDKTVEIISKYQKKMNIILIKNKKNMGLGYALKKGFEIAKNKNVMFLDADLSINIIDILKLGKLGKKNSMIIGSRYLKKSKIVGANYFKVKLSYFLNFFMCKVFNLNIIDLSHSFRIISKDIKLDSLNFTHPGFFWEITIKAKKKGVHLEELPITFRERKFGFSKNKSFKMLLSVLISLFNLLR